MVGPIYLENHSPLLSFLHALPDLPVPGELALSLPALPVPGELALSLSKGPGEPACPACPGHSPGEPACPEPVEWVEGCSMLSRAPAEKRCFCPSKERYWPQIALIFDNFSNSVN